MSNECFGFEELELWRKVRTFKMDICRLADQFPVGEKYKMTDHGKRSVRSINANIAEGHGRFTYPDQIHFCIMARGSLSETINPLWMHLMKAIFPNQPLSTSKKMERKLNDY